jgi:hypothetical protein
MSTKSSKKKKKKKVKKSEVKWGLEFNVFNRGIRQYLDIDYVNKLSPEEKEFLNQFVQTYYNNSFPKKSKPGRKTNMFDKAGIPRKEIFDQTNARNRDIYTTNYHIYDSEKNSDNANLDSVFDINRESYEEELTDYLDYKKIYDTYIKAGFDEDEARSKTMSDMLGDRNNKK